MKRRNYSGWAVRDPQALIGALNELGHRQRHPNVYAEHVTYRYPDVEPAPDVRSIRAVSYLRTDIVEALIVEVDGTTIRPDGRTYHITISVADGHRPAASNDAIAAAGHLTEPVDIIIDTAAF